MESVIMDDYIGKIKKFKSKIREDYEGEYIFTVGVGVIDNTIEVKDTVTMCKIVQTAVDSHNSDTTYDPESDKEEKSDSKTKPSSNISEIG